MHFAPVIQLAVLVASSAQCVTSTARTTTTPQALHRQRRHEAVKHGISSPRAAAELATTYSERRWVPRGRSRAVRRESAFHLARRRHPRQSAESCGGNHVVSDVMMSCRGGATKDCQVSTVGAGTQARKRRIANREGIARSAKIGLLFLLSYACSIGFNVNNKRALNLVKLPWTLATFNLLTGSLISLITWSFKIAPWPKINAQDVVTLIPIAFLHMVSHLTLVLGLEAGAVSFVQTIKAAEACFTAAFSVIFQGQILPLPVYLSLLPVVVGVGITSFNQPRFSWVALTTALLSNFSNALRNVLVVKNIGPEAAKRNSMRNQNSRNISSAANQSVSRISGGGGGSSSGSSTVAERSKAESKNGNGLANLSSGDTFRLLMIIGTVLLLPVAAMIECRSWGKLSRGMTDAAVEFAWREKSDSAFSAAGGLVVDRRNWAIAARHTFIAALCWNGFYDLCFRLLGQLHPVTHAVGNAFKRVFVIGAGALVFGGDLGGARGAFGSALAVSGVLSYSIAKIHCKARSISDRK